jgi:hypothetical protein
MTITVLWKYKSLYEGKAGTVARDGYTSKEQVLLIVHTSYSSPVIPLQLTEVLTPSTYSTPTTYSSQVIVRPKTILYRFKGGQYYINSNGNKTYVNN